MENFENEVFGFGNDINDGLEQASDFNYDSLSGLGESDYENDDLFNTEVETKETLTDDYNNDFMVGNLGSTNDDVKIDDENDGDVVANVEEFKIDEPVVTVKEYNEQSSEKENNKDKEEKKSVSFDETPIEELNKLTEYKEEKIEETDISSLFNKVSVNVKDASEIFRKNSDLKQKIDTRFNELKKLQSEIENSRKKQIDEVNSYKEEVLGKLTEKKQEIEKRLNLLKESQATLEKEKQEFEQYKKKEQDKIDKVKKEVQAAYDDRREELGHIEDVLRKQKDSLDEERSQLSLDKIQYESDKNELANNLLKFNDLVNSFTSGVSDVKE